MIKDWKDLEELAEDQQETFSPTMQSALRELQLKEQLKPQAKLAPFDWLLKDIAQLPSLGFNFKSILSPDTFQNLNEDAWTCLDMHLFLRDVKESYFPFYVSAVLKTFDHLVLHYIQDYKKDNFIIYRKTGEETSKYEQLKTYDASLQEVGTNLIYTYQLRNLNEHRYRTNEKTGKKFLKPVNKRDFYAVVPSFLKIASQNLLEAYKQAYPKSVVTK